MPRLEERDSNLSIVRTQTAGPTLLAGLTMFGLALIPMISAPGMTLPRLATAGVLSTVAAVLIQIGLPKKRVAVASLQDLARGPRRVRAIALSGDTDVEPPRYQAALVFDDAARVVILEDDEPALVFEQAEAVSRKLSVELELGWGLERGGAAFAPGSMRRVPAETARAKGEPATVAVFPAQQRVANAALGGAAFIALMTLWLAYEPPRIGADLTGISLILPALSVLLAVGFGLLFHSLKARLELRERSLERRFYLANFALGASRVVARDVLSIIAVAPDGTAARHLLVRTRDGFASVYADDVSALGLLAAPESHE
jgi:hypothetical protein